MAFHHIRDLEIIDPWRQLCQFDKGTDHHPPQHSSKNQPQESCDSCSDGGGKPKDSFTQNCDEQNGTKQQHENQAPLDDLVGIVLFPELVQPLVQQRSLTHIST